MASDPGQRPRPAGDARQAGLLVQAPGALVVHRDVLSSYHHVESAMAKPPAIVRQFNQTLLQGRVARVRLWFTVQYWSRTRRDGSGF
jgi:hypothetical protein